ncbi:hypothetical protein D3C76_1713720 [compost metagenome]
MQARFGLADIRAALSQLRWHADGEFLLRRRQLAGLQQLALQAARWLGGEQAQGVDQVIAARLQRWQARFDRGHLGPGLGHIQTGGNALCLAILGQL